MNDSKNEVKEPACISEERLKEIKTAKENTKWEQRRYEIASRLALQERRSVVLGKLNCSPEAIARNARKLADALIKELRTTKCEL